MDEEIGKGHGNGTGIGFALRVEPVGDPVYASHDRKRRELDVERPEDPLVDALPNDPAHRTIEAITLCGDLPPERRESSFTSSVTAAVPWSSSVISITNAITTERSLSCADSSPAWISREGAQQEIQCVVMAHIENLFLVLK